MKPNLDVSKLFPGRSQQLRDLAQKVIDRKAHPSELQRLSGKLRRKTQGAFGKTRNQPTQANNPKPNIQQTRNEN